MADDTEAEARELLTLLQGEPDPDQCCLRCFATYRKEPADELSHLCNDCAQHGVIVLADFALQAHAAGKAEAERIGEAKGLRRAVQWLRRRKGYAVLSSELAIVADDLEGKEGT